MNTAYNLRATSTSSSDRLRPFAGVLIALPVMCMIGLIAIYTVNVPWMDDIDAFLYFILGYTDAKTIGNKLGWLIRPNNEHRILTGKLITLAMYKLTGVVNFRWLVVAAFGFLLGLLYVFYRVFRSCRLPLLAFVPVCFLMLQPQFYLTSLWAITGLQHQVAVMLIFTTLYLLAGNERTRFVAAIGVQVLASLSMSNGLFGWVAGAVVLALQRRWTSLGLWLVLSVATIWFYFHDFPNGQGNESSVSFFLQYPYLIFSGFFTFLGGLFDFFPNAPIFWRSVLPTVWGLVLVLTMLGLLWQMNRHLLRRRISLADLREDAARALQKRRFFFTGGYAFLAVNATVVAFLRPRFGYDVMLVSNYMIYPAILTSLLYLNVLSEQQTSFFRNRWATGGLVMSIVIWGIWYGIRLPKVAYRKQQLLTMAFNQKHSETGLGPQWGTPFAEVTRQTMRESVRRTIYQYPDGYFTPYENQLVSPIGDTTAGPTLNVSGGGYSYIVTTTDEKALPEPVIDAALIVKSAQHIYLFPSELPYAPGAFYFNKPIKTLKAEIVNPILAPGQYQLGVLTATNPTKPVQYSPQTLTIP
jgi:hypothetical protein